jgi:hypothetical protein
MLVLLGWGTDSCAAPKAHRISGQHVFLLMTKPNPPSPVTSKPVKLDFNNDQLCSIDDRFWAAVLAGDNTFSTTVGAPAD